MEWESVFTVKVVCLKISLGFQYGGLLLNNTNNGKIKEKVDHIIQIIQEDI